MSTATAARAKPGDDARRSGRLLLRMPPALHGELAEAAEREGTSLNAYITQTLSESLSDEQPHAPGGPNRFIRIAVIVDLVMVAAATVTGAALLVIAWPT